MKMKKVMETRLMRSLFHRWWNENYRRQNIIMSPDYYAQLHSLLRIGQIKDVSLVRVGDTGQRSGDGAYIMADDFLSGGVAYSFGISDDVAWDNDMAKRGYDIYMYDPTIDELPFRQSKFHFCRAGISDGKNIDSNYYSLEYFLETNQHSENRNMILKMDVEGAEWGFLKEVKSATLELFDQIVFELHELIVDGNVRKKLQALQKLNATHQLVHLHPNNFGRAIIIDGKLFSNDIEATYIRRGKYSSINMEYDVKLPLPIDRPNRAKTPEMCLGYWNRAFEPKADCPMLEEIYLKR